MWQWIAWVWLVFAFKFYLFLNIDIRHYSCKKKNNAIRYRSQILRNNCGCMFFWHFIYLFTYFCLFMAGTPAAYGGFQAGGSNWSCSCWSQPQQCGIRAASVTYTITHGSARSLTRDRTCIFTDASQICFHWATRGIPSGILIYLHISPPPPPFFLLGLRHVEVP